MKINSPIQHLAFIRGLPCIRCNTEPSGVHQLGETAETAIPLCKECADVKFKLQAPVREMARNLWLLSGDIYSCINIVISNRGRIFE